MKYELKLSNQSVRDFVWSPFISWLALICMNFMSFLNPGRLSSIVV